MNRPSRCSRALVLLLVAALLLPALAVDPSLAARAVAHQPVPTAPVEARQVMPPAPAQQSFPDDPAASLVFNLSGTWHMHGWFDSGGKAFTGEVTFVQQG